MKGTLVTEHDQPGRFDPPTAPKPEEPFDQDEAEMDTEGMGPDNDPEPDVVA
jgi:hypothetical protein